MKLNAGADIKYNLTSNLTLDATINPDFGQVEVDPASLNLSDYETTFEEKAPSSSPTGARSASAARAATSAATSRDSACCTRAASAGRRSSTVG